MWRSMFLAAGAFCCILGAQCLCVEKAVLRSRQPNQRAGIMGGAFDATQNKDFVPPDWAPWTLLSSGAVTILYSFTLPARAKKQ